MQRLGAIIFFMIVVFTSKVAFTETFFDMSLSELFELKITAVSKKEELMATAPGVTSVITSKDIKSYGARTVAEAIAFAPGIMAYDSYVTWYNQFAFRGSYGGDHFNTKILFLVNGHPVYMALDGGFEVNAIPIDAIDRIEIIRGPASVLYGTNALTGVISIITKKEIPEAFTEISYSFGSFHTHEVRTSVGQSVGDFRYFFSGTFTDQKGYNLTVDPDQMETSTVEYKHRQSNEYNTAFLNMQYKDFELDISYSDATPTTKIGQIPDTLLPIGDMENEYQYIDFRYTNSISDQIDLNFRARYDKSTFTWDATRFYLLETLFGLPLYPRTIEAEFGNKKIGAELFVNINLMDKLDIISGVLYDRYYDAYYKIPNDQVASGYSPLTPWIGDKDNSDKAAYLNFNYKVSETLNLVGGTRFTRNKKSGNHWDYRAGLILPFNDNFVVKALYGTAYRSPNFYELTPNVPGIVVGDEDLDFETLDGTDLSIFYSYENKFVGILTYFWNRTEDFISRSGTQYQNFKGEESQGIDYELKYNPTHIMTVFLNGSYIFDHKDLETDRDLMLVEKIFNFGFTYTLIEDVLNISNSNRYCSSWDKSDSFIISNLALRYQPEFLDHIEISLYANNLFDKEYTYAEHIRENVETIPGGPPRSISAMLSIKY